MAPKRTTRANPTTTTTTTTTSVTDAQLEALIEQGVARALAARDADRNTNDDDSHNSGTSARRTERVTHLKKKMTDKYCPRVEIKKLKFEVWNLKGKGTDVIGYNQRFQELALMYVRMLPEESDKIERYIGVLPDMIHESLVASKPKTMKEAIEMASELMDKKIHTFAERQTENKRKQDDNNNQAQQQPLKKQGVAIAYTAGPGEKKESPAATNNHRNPTCYQCGNQGHYRSDCPELKNQDHGNQARGNQEKFAEAVRRDDVKAIVLAGNFLNKCL
nr:hypothetical protein [Tanacetum cinerariifolium]